MGIKGKYFSWTSASVTAGQDLIARAETLTGETHILAKKVNLISTGSMRLDINGLGTYSTLYKETDNTYRLTLESGDVIVGSLTVGDTSACPVFTALVY